MLKQKRAVLAQIGREAINSQRIVQPFPSKRLELKLQTNYGKTTKVVLKCEDLHV